MGFVHSLHRQGTQSDFNLLAIRLEREERRLNSDMEESASIRGVSYRPRSSVIPRNTARRISAKYVGSCDSIPFLPTLPHSRGDSFEDSGIGHRLTLLGSVGHPSLSSVVMEPTRLELPALGTEFKGREAFLDEVIEELNELQMVSLMQMVCLIFIFDLRL